MEWKLAEAKNRLSELVRRALADGPQRISRRREAVMVLDEREYKRLKGKGRDFKAFLKSGPSLDGVLQTRDRTPIRNVDI